MRKKYLIQVRSYPEGTSHYTSDTFSVLGEIRRVIRAEQIGNFNPFFARYMGKDHLVHSDAGDVSDPFRRKESYAASFFIAV